MTAIAFINQKGGCGKSCTSVHFAVWLYQCGFPVALIDADPQQSSSRWLQSLGLGIFCEPILDPDVLLERSPGLAQSYQYLIFDGAAGLAEATRAILLRSDLAAIPVQPTGLDLDSAAEAIRLARQAQSIRSGAPRACLFLSRATKGTRLLHESRSLLEKAALPVLSSTIYQRQIIADAFGQDATVFSLPGSAALAAAHDYELLFRELLCLEKL